MRNALLSILFIIFTSTLLSTAQSQIPGEVTQLINAKKYDAAISRLRKQVKTTKDVELAIVYSQIGEIYYDYMHNYPEAIKAYQKIIHLAPKDISDADLILSKMQMGNIYCRMGEYNNAIRLYQEIVNDYSKSDFPYQIAQRKIVNIRNALSDLEKQQRIIQNSAHKSPAIQARLDIAELYHTDLNQPQKAIEQYRVVVEQNPFVAKAPEAQWRVGYILGKVLHLSEEAVTAYRKVIQSYSNSNFAAEAYFQIGRIRESQGQYHESLMAFTHIITDYPAFWKYPAVFYWQGICYERLQDYKSAIDAYKIFLNVYLPDVDPVRLGDIGRYSENTLKIETEIEANIRRLQTDMPKVEWQKAQKLIRAGDYAAALPLYQNVISIAPESQYAQQAKASLKKTELRAAIQQWQKDIATHPQTITAVLAQFRIAETYEEGLHVLHDNYHEAIAEYRKVVAMAQEPSWAAKALYQIGIIYAHNLGDTDAATRTYQEVIHKYPDSTQAVMAQYQLAEIYRVLNKYTDALKAYHEIIAYPEHNLYSGEGYMDSFADAAQFRIGVVNYENLRDHKAALAAFHEFIKSRPSSPRLAAAYVFIGLINEGQANYQLATDAFEKAFDLVFSSNSVQAEKVVNEVISMDFGGSEQVQVLKRLRQKLGQLRVKIK